MMLLFQDREKNIAIPTSWRVWAESFRGLSRQLADVFWRRDRGIRLATACIEKPYEVGINFFDTANGYARGAQRRPSSGGRSGGFPRDTYVRRDEGVRPDERRTDAERPRALAQARHGAV